MFSGGIWAFHFGYDNTAFPSMERAAQLIHNSGKSDPLFSNGHFLPVVVSGYYASVRACAQRHTVVCLCVCVSVCVSVCLCITAITAQRLKCKCK